MAMVLWVFLPSRCRVVLPQILAASITVSSASLGSSSVDRDVFDAEALGLLLIVNLPVFEPTLSALSLLAADPAYSAIGTGAIVDGSPGELELSVNFADHKGNPTKGQAIAWGHHQYRLLGQSICSGSARFPPECMYACGM